MNSWNNNESDSYRLGTDRSKRGSKPSRNQHAAAEQLIVNYKKALSVCTEIIPFCIS